jgi:hypothetical protein
MGGYMDGLRQIVIGFVLQLLCVSCAEIPKYSIRAGDDYTKQIYSMAEGVCGEALPKQDPVSRHLCLDSADRVLQMATRKAGHDYLVESKLPAQAERNRWETILLPGELITKQVGRVIEGVSHLRVEAPHDESEVSVSIGAAAEPHEDRKDAEWDAELLRGLLQSKGHTHNAASKGGSSQNGF